MSGFSGIKEVKLDNPEKVMSEFKATGSVELRNKLVMHYLNLVNLAIYSMRSVLLSNIPFEDFFTVSFQFSGVVFRAFTFHSAYGFKPA